MVGAMIPDNAITEPVHPLSANASHNFPVELESALLALGKELANGTVPVMLFDEVMERLSALPPQSIGWADGKIAGLARLYPRPPPTPTLGARLLRLLQVQSGPPGLLSENPMLAPLLLFHRDGFVREAALERMTAPQSPFFLAALAWRLNDWAEPVRQAAHRCAERVFASSEADVVFGAAPFLLTRWLYWRRWDPESSMLIDALLARPDVSVMLATQRFEREAEGSLGRELRLALRIDALDTHLPSLAKKARQPAVRAVALRTLLSGHASWPTGFATIWVDKRYGLTRRVMRFGNRPLKYRPSPEALIAQGLQDGSAMVRRVAADGLIEHRAIYPGLEAAIDALSQDRSAALRARARWLTEKLAEEEKRAN